MKLRLIMLLGAAAVGWSTPSLAAPQNAAGAGITPLDANGVLNGVILIGPGTTGTVTIGNQDVFTTNNPLAPGSTAIATDTNSQGNVIFNGNSTVFGAVGAPLPGGPILLNLSGGATGSTVNFLGAVTATTLTVTGTGTVNFNSGSVNTLATSFGADGTVGLSANTTLNGAITTVLSNTGTLILDSGTLVNGAVGGGPGIKAVNLSGSNSLATITGALNTFSASLGNNTLNVNGALAIASGGAGGVINTTLTSAAVFGNIRPTGATSLGTTLLVNVTVAAGANIPVGTVFNIVQTRGGAQTGTNGTIVTVTSLTPGYVFAAVPVGGVLNGLVAITLISGPAPSAVVTLAQLSPSAPSLGAPYVAFQTTGLFQELWLSHLNDTMCSQVRQPRPGEDARVCARNTENGWWLKGFGSFGSQGMQDGFSGYGFNVVGTMLAYDLVLSPNTRIGLGVGYARSSIYGYTADPAHLDINTYRTTAYVGHEQGPWFVYGEASFGWNEYSGTRSVAGLGSAQAAYSGQEYTSSVTTGYHFAVQQFTVTPILSLQYTHLDIASYAETGGGLINLAVASQSYDFLQSGVGATLARPFSYDDQTYVPEVHAKWLHLLDNPTVQNTASLPAAGVPSFTITGATNSSETFDVGAGFTLLSCGCSSKTWSLEAVYDYYWRSDNFYAHKGMLKFSSRF